VCGVLGKDWREKDYKVKVSYNNMIEIEIMSCLKCVIKIPFIISLG
jgi:hypothetical protein